MNVLVVGSSQLAVQVATTLAASGCEVIYVRADADGADEPHDPRISVVVGDPLVVLEEAGALRTDVLVACTTSDAENLVVSFLAKHRFHIGCVVARVNDPDDSWLFDESWGIDVAVSAAGLVAETVLRAPGASAAPAAASAPPPGATAGDPQPSPPAL